MCDSKENTKTVSPVVARQFLSRIEEAVLAHKGGSETICLAGLHNNLDSRTWEFVTEMAKDVDTKILVPTLQIVGSAKVGYDSEVELLEKMASGMGWAEHRNAPRIKPRFLVGQIVKFVQITPRELGFKDGLSMSSYKKFRERIAYAGLKNLPQEAVVDLTNGFVAGLWSLEKPFWIYTYDKEDDRRQQRIFVECRCWEEPARLFQKKRTKYEAEWYSGAYFVPPDCPILFIREY